MVQWDDFSREDISGGKIAEKLLRCHISMVKWAQDEQFCLGGETVLHRSWVMFSF